MKFKRWGNLLELVGCWILSYITACIGVYLFYGKASVISIYLICSVISLVLFLLLSLNRRSKAEGFKKVIATIVSSKYWYLSNIIWTYEFTVGGKKKEAEYLSTVMAKEGKTEEIYVNDEKNYAVRQDDVTLFKKKGLSIISIIAIVLFVIAIYSNTIQPLKSLAWYEYTKGEICGYMFLFKFMSVFLVFAYIFLYILLNLDYRKYNKVTGKVIDVIFTNRYEESYADGGDVYLGDRVYVSGTAKYEYTFRGEKKVYVSTQSGSSWPEVGTTKRLYVDDDGIVVAEKGTKWWMFIFFALCIFFYTIGVWGPVEYIIQSIG